MPRLHPFREPMCRQMECAAQKRGSSRRFCIELSKQNLPIERALPSLLVVARRCLRAARDTRSASLGAAAPPLSKKFFDTFWEPYVRGTPLRMRAAFTPSVSRCVGKWGREKTFLYYTIYYRDSFRFLLAAGAGTGAGTTHPTSAGNGHSFTTYATPKAPTPVWMDSTGPITR